MTTKYAPRVVVDRARGHEKKVAQQRQQHERVKTANYFSQAGFHSAQIQRLQSPRSRARSSATATRRSATQNLMKRRLALRDMLDGEKEENAAGMSGLVPTGRDKVAAMRSRAEGLKTARESRRKAEATAKYRQHLVEGDHGLRAVDRELQQDYVTTERSAQLDEQRARAAQQARDKAVFEAEWREKQAAATAAAAEKQRQTRYEAEEYASSLQQQVAELTVRDAEATRIREEYDELKAEMNSMFLEQEAREKREAAIRTVRYGRTLQRQHKELLKKQSEEVKESLVEDLRMLEELAKAEEQNQEVQTERRKKAKADVEWMKEEVQQQLDEEMERQARFDILYRDEAQRMFAKQEAVWDREKLMRKKLMDSVLQERAEQLKEREAILRQKSAKSVREREELIESIERERQFTVREAHTQRELVRDRRDELDIQMDRLASERAADLAAETAREQTARAVARRKQQILDEEEMTRRGGAAANSYQPPRYGRVKVAWY